MKLAILEHDWHLPKNRKYARREFARKLSALGIKINPFLTDVRSPLQNRNVLGDPNAKHWHKDGRGEYNWLLIVWSNKYPTQLRERRSKKQIILPAKAIVIFDNDYYRHRPDPNGNNRWFLRYYLHKKDLPKKFKKSIWIAK